MAVGTNIVWNTEPIIQDNNTTNNENGPLFLACFTAPKGPEDLRIVTGDFDSLYGTNYSFAKFGQPLLQARRIISAGGRLLCRRLLPEDATLSNLIIVATVEKVESGDNSVAQITYHATSLEGVKDPKEVAAAVAADTLDIEVDGETEEVQKTNEDGEKLYYTEGSEGTEYTESDPSYNVGTSKPVMITVPKTIKAYPLFTVSDNGRGNTGKSVRIDFKSTASRTNRQTIYTITDVENGVDVKTTNFTLNPDIIINEKSYAISNNINPQFVCSFAEAGYAKFIEVVSEYSKLDVDDLGTADLLFGRTYRGDDLTGVKIVDTDENPNPFNYTYGMLLQGGTDGAADITFSTNPESAYSKLTEKFFDPDEGTDGEDVYNVDIYKIDAVADANFSLPTKAKIVKLAEFRKDFYYFRDLGLGEDGLGLTTFDAIDSVAKQDEYIVPSKFAASFHTSYKVYDPFTQKPDHVTCLYSLVDSIVSHFVTGRHLPFAGYKITDYIPGTIDFIPKRTPKVDQVELLEAIKVNIITFSSLTNFIMQTMNTTTPVDGQLNYIQNVLAVQHVIKDIRTFCPANRTAFFGKDDFDDYAEAISDNVLVHHMTKFDKLQFAYNNDNDILTDEFVASLIFSFNKHIQAETFNIFAED